MFRVKFVFKRGNGLVSISKFDAYRVKPVVRRAKCVDFRLKCV